MPQEKHYMTTEPVAGLLNKSYCLAPILDVTKVMTMLLSHLV